MVVLIRIIFFLVIRGIDVKLQKILLKCFSRRIGMYSWEEIKGKEIIPGRL